MLLVAKAHLLAYTTAAAANQRYLIEAESFSYQLFVNIIREKFPELSGKTPAGSGDGGLAGAYKLDNSKSKRELGITYRPMEETIADTVQSLRELEKRVTA
jgi:nucleoside-diphosphate-sugar epimerase